MQVFVGQISHISLSEKRGPLQNQRFARRHLQKMRRFRRTRQAYKRLGDKAAWAALALLFWDCHRAIETIDMRELLKQSVEAVSTIYPSETEALVLLGNIYIHEDSSRTARDCFTRTSKINHKSQQAIDGLYRSITWAQSQKGGGGLCQGLSAAGAVVAA